MTRLLGALGGAILAPVLVLAVVILYHLLTYDGPSTESWDFVTPMLTMAAMVIAAFIGLVAGALVAHQLAAGRSQSAWTVLAVSAALVLATPVWVNMRLLRPRTKPRPPDAIARQGWARALVEHHGLQRPPVWDGLGLASDLERHLRRSGGSRIADTLLASDEALASKWYGLGPDSLAARGKYVRGDEGWRWEVLSEAPPRVLVFPDPLLPWRGPVFEVRPYGILRRQERGAPGFSTDEVLPMLALAHRCVAAMAAGARRAGEWDGGSETFHGYLRGVKAVPAGCPRLEVPTRRDGTGEPWLVYLSFRDVPGFERLPNPRIDLRVRPSSSGGDFPFELSAASRTNVYYMVDASGAWHMREGAPATVNDPPPPKCLFDLSVPCE